ncbi:hypothetical protein ACHAXA_010736 [Cyclostephanos tholiformis]|uniref:Uncharacterized protein n=1 Tax=Cyclostephanos tholiformis TaxID=382380 RepID=A0ABD3RFD6_9STRA
MKTTVKRAPPSSLPRFSPKKSSRIFVSVGLIVSSLRPPAASSLVANDPRRRPAAMSQLNTAIAMGKMRMDTSLRSGDDNYYFTGGGGGSDFASLDDYFQRGEDEGRRLAMEFYLELRHRREDGDEPLRGYEDEINDEDSAGTGSTYPKNDHDAGGVRSSSSVRRAFANRPAKSSSSSSSSSSRESSSSPFTLFHLLSLFPANAPRPATSAGLFSGTGTTVYSSGRSLRAEIELLETSFEKNNDNDIDLRRWMHVGTTTEQLDDALRLVALSLIMLSTVYVAIETSGGAIGGMDIMTWDGAAASANRIMALMNDGMSGVVVGVGNGEVFVGDEAAWLLRETSGLAAIVVDAVRSVERLVLS